MKSKPGTYVALFMLLLAAIATGANLWYQRHRSARPLALWGVEPARLIGLAPQVEVLRLAPVDAASESPNAVIAHSRERLQIVETKDASEARGLKNIRQGLLDGRSFDWNASRGDCDPQWEYALRFSDGESSAAVLFALNCRRVALAGAGAEASVGPTLAAYEGFLREQFPGLKTEIDRSLSRDP
ncbi:MAG: hypothetical protein HY000_07330 [Planctomycetes bacterium]|nr:hypothetical protein [Planctomycetota bacterium]